VQVFLCVVNQTTFRELRNGRFPRNLVTKRILVSRHGIAKDIFENFYFRGHLPPKSKIGQTGTSLRAGYSHGMHCRDRDTVYSTLQQSSIFRIQLCVSTLSKDQQRALILYRRRRFVNHLLTYLQSCLVAFVEHFPTIRNLSWFALLDLSAAFDTVDHHILLGRLQSAFAIHGSFIDWIQSFITNRSQTVSFAGDMSTESVVTCGVPRGSVLGRYHPLSFIYC